jgi:hypothetical protein
MRNKRKTKPGVVLKTKEGPRASLCEALLKDIGRHYWIVLSNWSFESFGTPKLAKAAWRASNAKGWQKKHIRETPQNASENQRTSES